MGRERGVGQSSWCLSVAAIPWGAVTAGRIHKVTCSRSKERGRGGRGRRRGEGEGRKEKKTGGTNKGGRGEGNKDEHRI